MKETDQEFAAKALRLRVDVFTNRLSRLASCASNKVIHDARVESRRMRAALKAFHPMFPSRPYRTAYKEIRRITDLLGKPRQTAVNLKMVKDLASEVALEPSCLEYLVNRLHSGLKKQVARINKKIRRIDPRHIESRLEFLISVMESDPANPTEKVSNSLQPPLQPTLFPMRQSAASQAARTLQSAIAPISAYRTEPQFDVSADAELHSLRITAKKARYAMEVYSPVWPGGLDVPIEKARRFQDAGGSYHDWSMLLSYLEKQIERLNSKDSARLAFETGRLAASAELRKATLKISMRAALLELQESVASLDRAIAFLLENPDLSVMKGSPAASSPTQSRSSRVQHSMVPRQPAVPR